MKKQWKRLAVLSSAAVMAAGTLLYFPTDTLQNISWGITASAEETGAATWTQTESDNLVWTLDADGTLTISGTGPMRDYFHDSPATQKKDSVERVVIEDGVTSIGIFAFQYCRRLTNITIPESVTSIGDSAFRYCSSLTSITIPESVTSIGNAAFSDTPWLTNKQQGNSPVIVNGILIDGTACSGEVTIPEGVTSIGDFAFSGCSSMTSITIPDSVKSIGDSAFEWCTGLTSIEIPEGVTSIGEFVFFSCHKLTEVFLENGSKLTSGNLGVDESIIGTYWNEGDLTWTLTADGTLTISGTGAMKDYSYDSPACDNSNIKKVVIEDGVTSIGDSAFSDCRSLTDITIPGSVTSIGNGAFSGCSSLTDITIPSSVTSIGNGAFSGCSSLTDITIPSSVTSIGESAFESCTDLTSITIPKSVTSIGSNVFDGCTALTEVLLEGGSTLTSENFGEVANKVVTRWNEDNLTWTLTADGTLTISGTGAMKEYGAGSSPAAQKKDSVKKVVIEDGITNIVDFAFFDCTVLESIEIPGSVASIGNFAFCSCIRLTDITIPGSVTSIGDYAFFECSSLTGITIPSSVTSIGNNVFRDCSSLTSITIPESVTSIGNYAFKYCSSLTDITIPGSVTSIGTYAFSGCTALTEVLLENGSTLTSENFGEVADKVVIRWNEGNLTWTLDAEGTMAISGTGAMKNYGTNNSPAAQKKASVKKVVIEDGITSIGDYAFFDCSSLTSIEIPEGVTSIGEGAFSNCRNLASIEIPESVTSIGDFAFFGCGDSLEITVSCDSTLKKDAFGDASEKVKYRHSLVKTDAKDATYTEAGNVEYWTCENCKKHFLSDETDVEAAKEVELSATVKPVPVQVATATTQIKCVYGQDMDEINLQDYVKNADAVGGVSVKVATGSTMLDGMQLDGNKISGKPAKVYTDGKDVTFTFTAKNGNTANLTLQFLVAKADPMVKVAVDGDSHTEGDLVSELKLILSGNNTKGLAEIISEIKALTAGENTLTWKFTPEDSENYNVVTGTVVVNAQTTTTTTTTTTATTTTTTTTTNETTSTTKATTTTNETTATTEGTTTTSETTATTEETTITNETTTTPEETTTTNETIATTEATTVTTNETTATTEETTTTNETTTTTEAITTTSGTTSTTKATTATSETTATTATTEASTVTTNETTTTTKGTTTTNETTATTATSGTTSATKATTTTSRTTSATKATTATSGTTATTFATKATTTSVSNTESTAATSATTITTAATTSVTNIADEDLCSWAINDYQKKAGIVPANAEITARSEEACEITLTDENGNVLDVYTIDPKTGTGTDSSNAEVNLPQTGNNSMTNWLLCVGAAMFMAFGFGAVKASGIFKRKEEE